MPISFSLTTFVQYAVFSIIAYILAGAPFSSIIYGSEKQVSVQQYSFDKIESLMVPDSKLECEEHGYKVHIFNREPLVIYIEGFVSKEEARHIVEIRYVLVITCSILTIHESYFTSFLFSLLAFFSNSTPFPRTCLLDLLTLRKANQTTHRRLSGPPAPKNTTLLSANPPKHPFPPQTTPSPVSPNAPAIFKAGGPMSS
jgi:hypothetical protein